MQYAITAKNGAPQNWQSQVKSIISCYGGNPGTLLAHASKKDIKAIEALGFCNLKPIEIKLPTGLSS